MNKQSARSKVVDDFKEDVRSVMSEAKHYVSLTLKTSYMSIRKLRQIDFANTQKGYDISKKFDKKVEDMTETYKTLNDYQHASYYMDITKEFMTELRDTKPHGSESEEDAYGDVYREYKKDLDDIKTDIRDTYQKYIRQYTELIRFVKEQQRKEAIDKMGKNGKELSVQEYAENYDDIKKAIYERCASGDIDVDEREELIAQLNIYKGVNSYATEAVLSAIDDYMEGTLDTEELDNILTGYYDENADVKELFMPDYLDDMYDIMRESVSDDYHSNEIDSKTARKRLAQISAVYESDMYDHFNNIIDPVEFEEFTQEAPIDTKDTEGILESYINCTLASLEEEEEGTLTKEDAEEVRDNLSDLFENFMESFDDGPDIDYLRAHSWADLSEDVKNINESVAMEEISDDEGYERYKDAVHSYYESMILVMEADNDRVKDTKKQEDDATVDTKALSRLAGVFTNLIAVPVGTAVRGPKGTKVLKAYEEMNHPDIMYGDIKVNHLSLIKDKDTVSKYFGSEINSFQKANCKENEPPIVEASVGKYGNEIFFVAARIRRAGAKTEPYKLIIKGVSGDFNKHKDYYETGISYKIFREQTKASKEFVRKVASAANAIVKKAEAVEDKIDKNEKSSSENLSKIIKESTVDEVTNIYNQTLNKINALYEQGSIDLEKRESLVMETRQKLFG